MKQCKHCKQNEARYIDFLDQWLCGVCDAKAGTFSIRISDVGELVRRISVIIDYQPSENAIQQALRDMISDGRRKLTVSPSK